MSATRTSGAGRPAEAKRSVAGVPSARKCSAGAIVETIIGASGWPYSWAITAPIAPRACSSRAVDIGAAPYQKHCRDERFVDSSAGLTRRWRSKGGGRKVGVEHDHGAAPP